MPDGSIELRAPGESPLQEPTPGSDTAQMEAPDDPTVRRPPTDAEEYQRRSLRSSRYAGDDPHHGYQGRGQTVWDRVLDLVTVEPPLGSPSTDPMPADAGPALASMAGWNGGEIGHDAMDGIDRLVTGEVNAMREMEAPSATRGTPLQMEESESVYRSMDDTVHGLSLPPGPEDMVDDRAELSYRDPGGLGDGDSFVGTADSPADDFDWMADF